MKFHSFYHQGKFHNEFHEILTWAKRPHQHPYHRVRPTDNLDPTLHSPSPARPLTMPYPPSLTPPTSTTTTPSLKTHPSLPPTHTTHPPQRLATHTLHAQHQTSRPQTTPHPPTVSLSRITRRETAPQRAQPPSQAPAHVATCLYVSQTVRGIRGSSGEVCGMAPLSADQHASQYPPGHPIDGSLPYT